ncbi:MAG: methyltransferase domain-containing protein [Verrucomicrobiota bacterium]
MQDLVFSSGVIKSYSSGELWSAYEDYLKQVIRFTQARQVCDIGGGRNPSIDHTFITEHELKYTLLDISQEELDAAPAAYSKIQADIGDVKVDLPEASYDLCFSKMVAEHIQDGEAFHRNVHRLLKPEGLAIHFFPTLYTLPYVVNLMVPEWLSTVFLKVFNPRDLVQHGKFPAYYSRCYGPIASQLSFLESLDYEIVHYHAGFGHGYYRRLPVVREVAAGWSRWCCRNDWFVHSAFAVLVMRRQGGPDPVVSIPILPDGNQ